MNVSELSPQKSFIAQRRREGEREREREREDTITEGRRITGMK
jgi:hypothetical protein